MAIEVVYRLRMGSAWSSELVEWVRGSAVGAGFDLCGVAGAPASGESEGVLTAERFSEWVAGGRAGEMEYLKRRDEAGELLRRSARVAMPWVRSVVVCALNYHAEGPLSVDAAAKGAGWIGRYAWSGGEDGEPVDYHDDLMRRLKVVEAGLVARVSSETLQTKCYVDTGPLLERDFAARAGVGWVGKNTCVINQGVGSWLLLGVIVCSLEVETEAAALVAADRCGSCTRCIEACPTGALVASREMDASLCIAYLTIEKKGAIAEELREKMGRQVFGCDICQDVCPWNRKAPVGDHVGFRARGELVNPSLDWLGGMSADEFRRWFKGSPLERTKRHRVQRNVAIAMGNSGDESFVPKLMEWAGGEDAVLAESAGWALRRLGLLASRQRAWMLSEDVKKSEAEPEVKPIEAVKPTVREDGAWPQVKALAMYMASTEVHTYAFSVAANVILSLFPFIVLLLTLAQKVFHSPAMVAVVGDLLRTILPNNQDFIVRNMTSLVHPHGSTRVFSVVMLLITSTGVFLPLEVALNNVWGVKENRNYLQNQMVSLGLAAAVGALAMASVALATGQQRITTWIFFGHTDNIFFNFLAGGVLKICAVVMSVLLFFLIYWVLPHRKIPAMAVLPTAIVIGLSWEVAKYLYVLALPHLDFESVYGPFKVSVGLMMWAFLSGLMLLAGAHFSATRYTLRLAREAEAE
ncbi:tRNA epoxyqueuosine(34) reductase QueG [Granulicella tundricola]